MSFTNEAENYTITKDMADAVRIEASALPPRAHESNVMRATKMVRDEMINRYSQYMPDKTIRDAKELQERLFATNKDTFDLIYKHWPTITDDQMAAAANFYDGNLAVIQTPEDIGLSIWEYLPQQNKRDRIAATGSLEETILELGESVATYHITHESIHQLHSRTIPNYFAESGIFYYQKELSKWLPFNTYFSIPSTEAAIASFERTIERYGNEAQHTFFGTEKDPAIKRKIEGFLYNDLIFTYPDGVDMKGIL